MALTLGEAGFDRLAAMLDATFARNARDGAVEELGRGLYGHSLFYRAVGTFNVLRVCNHWISDLLGAAGVPTAPVLATMPQGLLWDLTRRAGAVRLPPAGQETENVMANLKLTLACWNYDRTRPLIDGRVKPDGIDLDIQILRPRQSFQRMLDNKEFQLSELSLASYTALKARGDCPFVAVPVALSKIFRHSCIYVRKGAGIEKPEDLRGKRVGTSQYSSTGLCFMRGMLEHDYGIKSEDMHWFMGGLNTFVEQPLIPLDLPKA